MKLTDTKIIAVMACVREIGTPFVGSLWTCMTKHWLVEPAAPSALCHLVARGPVCSPQVCLT